MTATVWTWLGRSQEIHLGLAGVAVLGQSSAICPETLEGAGMELQQQPGHELMPHEMPVFQAVA